MLLRVTCAGVDIGSADFPVLDGLAHTTLTPNAGYDYVRDTARSLGEEFAVTQFWSQIDGDFAEHAASRWTAGRLALEDLTGREMGVNSILVLDLSIGADFAGEGKQVPRVARDDIRVVADCRPDMARVEAFLRTMDSSSGGRSRPAA
ncbi:MAG: hypothetical protein ABI664_11245 [bacterium]